VDTVVACPPWAGAEVAGAEVAGVFVTVLVSVTGEAVTGGAVTETVSGTAVTVTVRGGSPAVEVDDAVLLVVLGLDDEHPAMPSEATASTPVAMVFFNRTDIFRKSFLCCLPPSRFW
jgi:hypothetical protein